MKGAGNFDVLTAEQRRDIMDRLARDCGWLSAAHARTAVLATRRELGDTTQLAGRDQK